MAKSNSENEERPHFTEKIIEMKIEIRKEKLGKLTGIKVQMTERKVETV